MFKIKGIEGAAAAAGDLNLEKFLIDDFKNPYHQMVMAIDSALLGLSQTIVQAGEAQRSFRNLLDGTYTLHRERCERDILEGRGVRATAAKLNGTYVSSDYVKMKFELDEELKSLDIDELMKIFNPTGSDSPVWVEVRNAIQYSFEGKNRRISPHRLYNYLFRTSDISNGTAPMTRCGVPVSADVIKPYGIYDLIEKDLPSGLYEMGNAGYGHVPQATPFYVKSRYGGVFNETALLIGEGATNGFLIMVKCEMEGVWVRTSDHSYYDVTYVASEMINYFVENFEVDPAVNDLKSFVDNAFDVYEARVAELAENDPMQIDVICEMYEDKDSKVNLQMSTITRTDHYDLRRYIANNGLSNSLLVKPQPEPTSPEDPPIASWSLKTGTIVAVLHGSYIKFQKVQQFGGDEILHIVTIGHKQITGNNPSQSSWVNIPYHIRLDILKKYMSVVADFRKRR